MMSFLVKLLIIRNVAPDGPTHSRLELRPEVTNDTNQYKIKTLYSYAVHSHAFR